MDWWSGWRWLGRDARKLRLASSYPRIIARVIGREWCWWDWHRWNGTAGVARQRNRRME